MKNKWTVKKQIQNKDFQYGFFVQGPWNCGLVILGIAIGSNYMPIFLFFGLPQLLISFFFDMYYFRDYKYQPDYE